MPRERLPLKREYKGDATINIADIFRNQEVCKKLKPNLRKNVQPNT